MELMTTVQLADRVKALISKPSYDKIGMKLQINGETVRQWYYAERVMNDDTAISIAELLNLDPEMVLTSIAAERAMKTGSDKVSQYWQQIAAQHSA
ncbi:hypothetical protein [Alcanivorax sp.]|uniref:hypothetical protein n=1 Tax=Alcanivorax sp. TaxID=1872427 RepID=UPI0025C735FA|nr:hypothetical protein [Alcanivorax sp.]